MKLLQHVATITEENMDLDKRISTLEKENASLKKALEELQRQFKWHQHHYDGQSRYKLETSKPLPVT